MSILWFILGFAVLYWLFGGKPKKGAIMGLKVYLWALLIVIGVVIFAITTQQ